MGVFAPNGSTAATVGGTSVWLWEPYGEPRLRGIHVHAAPATAVTFDPTGTLLASADSGGTVVVQKAHGGPVRSFTAGSGIVALSWAQDGHLLVAGKNGSLQLRTGDGAQVSRVFSHGGPITAAALRADGATVASADADGTVRLWRTSSATELLTLHAGAPVGAVALDPTGRLVAVGAGDDVLVFSATTGSKVETLTGHTDTVTGVAFSPDGLELASSSRDHDARLWLTDGFRLLQVLHRHTAFLSGVAFSSDGRWLATAGALKAGIWSASQQSDLPGSFLLFARGNAAPLSSVAWSPHGWELATASRDGSIRVVDCTLCGGWRNWSASQRRCARGSTRETRWLRRRRRFSSESSSPPRRMSCTSARAAATSSARRPSSSQPPQHRCTAVSPDTHVRMPHERSRGRRTGSDRRDSGARTSHSGRRSTSRGPGMEGHCSSFRRSLSAAAYSSRRSTAGSMRSTRGLVAPSGGSTAVGVAGPRRRLRAALS